MISSLLKLFFNLNNEGKNWRWNLQALLNPMSLALFKLFWFLFLKLTSKFYGKHFLIGELFLWALKPSRSKDWKLQLNVIIFRFYLQYQTDKTNLGPPRSHDGPMAPWPHDLRWGYLGPYMSVWHYASIEEEIDEEIKIWKFTVYIL